MFSDEHSDTEKAVAAIFALLLIPVGVVVQGVLIAYAWQELVLPIFPSLPVISNWQGLGFSTFVSLFMIGLERNESSGGKKSYKVMFLTLFFKWALYFLFVWGVSQSY